MSASSEKFSDLAARMSSAAVMAVVGIGAVWAGGFWFMALLTLVCGALVWELVRMLGAGQNRALTMGALAAGSFLAVSLLPPGLGLPFILVPAMAGIALLSSNRTLYMVFAALIVISCYGLAILRVDFGFVWMLWLALVVIATDVLGYFAGRIFGGPKFWPRVSPKKTWSGTVAGWVAAALVGAAFMTVPGVGLEILGISVAISMASQMGDIAESAVKRKMGVKDSSNLIPGHGGVFDRFDGMLGASVFLLLIEQVVDFPPALIG
ncbi:phosphatidate cytidylyltransferase [Litoreibacter halocynthiae]|uniref:Phosphatidate cytidylyltransferase n=1 Tax=Litoreibacter halocynthiae TaxID=1242689 RepID=A0A4R7LNS8_9RHOB|nr:phosphatidate cytidylyltransferase [Litoreibacter halocynthiae]TDT77723.1 phosphatidate cytidylyltransferase [Litoreibacter halocynthiae]